MVRKRVRARSVRQGDPSPRQNVRKVFILITLSLVWDIGKVLILLGFGVGDVGKVFILDK